MANSKKMRKYYHLLLLLCILSTTSFLLFLYKSTRFYVGFNKNMVIEAKHQFPQNKSSNGYNHNVHMEAKHQYHQNRSSTGYEKKIQIEAKNQFLQNKSSNGYGKNIIIKAKPKFPNSNTSNSQGRNKSIEVKHQYPQNRSSNGYGRKTSIKTKIQHPQNMSSNIDGKNMHVEAKLRFPQNRSSNIDGKNMHVEAKLQFPQNRSSKSQHQYSKNRSSNTLFVKKSCPEHQLKGIVWQNKIWQILEYNYTAKENGSMKQQRHLIYAYKLYYDNRFNKRELKGFVTSIGYLNTNITFLCDFWIMDNNEKIFKSNSASKCRFQRAGISVWKVAGKAYIPYLITCPMPSIVSTSAIISVSLSCSGKCHTESKTCVEVIIPKRPKIPAEKTKTIGVCLKGLYYDMKNDTVTQFVQWMETILLLGVHHVTLYNTTITETSHFAKPVFDYYIKMGRLSVIDFPTIATNWNRRSPYEKKSAAELLQAHSTGDCFYRNLYNYWYMLHIDMDEIPVPRQDEPTTYQEVLTAYLKKHPESSDAFSISMKSAFNYLDFSPSHPEIPEYMSLLRHAYRMPVDTPKGSNAGYMKSFINPRKCEIVWAHRCITGNYVVVDETDIFINHYRDSCRLGKQCETEWKRRIMDTHLLNTYGVFIQRNSEEVLKRVGFIK